MQLVAPESKNFTLRLHEKVDLFKFNSYSMNYPGKRCEGVRDERSIQRL